MDYLGGAKGLIDEIFRETKGVPMLLVVLNLSSCEEMKG